MGLEERKQTKLIDGVTYEVTPLPFGIGRRALMRLLKVISPLIAASGGSGLGVFEVLPTALTDDDVAYFGEVFGKASKYESAGNWVPLIVANQDLHFAERYLAFMQWLMFNIEVNYKGFFSGLMDGSAGLGSLLKTVSASPSQSTAGPG